MDVGSGWRAKIVKGSLSFEVMYSNVNATPYNPLQTASQLSETYTLNPLQAAIQQ